MLGFGDTLLERHAFAALAPGDSCHVAFLSPPANDNGLDPSIVFHFFVKASAAATTSTVQKHDNFTVVEGRFVANRIGKLETAGEDRDIVAI